MAKSRAHVRPKAAPKPENGGKPPEEQGVGALLDEIQADALDIIPEELIRKADLSLPAEFREELMADELLGVLGTYHRSMSGWRAAKNLGDNQRREQMNKLANYSRLTATLIMADNPAVKAVADEMARFRAARAKRERADALSDEEE